MEKIRFFGDSVLSVNDSIIYFPSAKVVCDYSECGLYIANKHMDIDNPIETTLEAVIKMFDPETIIEAENNGIARFFERNNIKTLKDLIAYFNHY